MMDVTYHPLKDPSLWIHVVASNVQCCIELEQKLFIPVFLICEKLQESSVSEAIQRFFKAGQASYSFSVETHMWKYAPLIV